MKRGTAFRCIALLALPALSLVLPARAADWIEYRSGPFHVYSDAGDRAARERLVELEQLRHVLGVLLGKSGIDRGGAAKELTLVWPVHLVLFTNQREYAPHALKNPLMSAGGSTIASWSADTGKDVPLPYDLVRAVTQTLIEDNAGRMPQEIEVALADLLSTIEVNATRVKIGAPLQLTGYRLAVWAKLQMMATQPMYSGKLGIYLNNLQNASDEDTASRNAFEVNAAKLNADAAAYLRAGTFEAAPVSGAPINPNKDFIEKNLDKAAASAAVAELSEGNGNFPPNSPRGLVAKNTRAALELAIKANPRWAEPHAKMAVLETNPAAKLAQWKLATSLEPRNAGYWQTFAELQASVSLFNDAEKTWSQAERAAINPAERTRIHQAKLNLEDQRAAALIAGRKAALEEEARDLQRVKDSAAEEVRAAERRVNDRLRAERGDTATNDKPIPLSELSGNPTGARVAGMLTRVECVGASLRLTIQQDTPAPSMRLLIRDPHKLNVALNSGDVTFACGPLKMPRRMEVQHNAKADAKLGTAGDITLVNFPD